MNRKLLHILCLVLTSSITGCAITRHSESSDQAQTMQEIYDSHYERHSAKAEGNLRDFDDESEFSNQLANEIETTFPVLDNPLLIMYVFPHVVTEGRLPVPGYWTAVPLYERVEFAEPGEGTSKKSAPH